MEKETARGGTRENSGRKPVADKKVQVAIYLKNSDIDKFGGMAAAKLAATTYMEERAATLPEPKKRRGHV